MGDALREVLDDPEIHEIRVEGLKEFARTDPVGFELRLVGPRSEKFSTPVYEVPLIPLSPEEERCFVDESTGGPRNANETDLRPTAPIDTVSV